MTTVDQLFALQARQNEVFKRVKSGGLSIGNALAGTQGILDGIYPTRLLPEWYTSPEEQIEKVKAFLEKHGGGDVGYRPEDIPAIPTFTPRTTTEVLLLVALLPDKGRVKGLHRSLKAWWEVAEAPQGYTKTIWDGIKFDAKHVRMAPGLQYHAGVYWIAIDPVANKGKSPKDCLEHPIEGTSLAGIEVLILAALCPGWAVSWNGDSSPFPNMSALQFYWNVVLSHVLYLSRWDVSREFELSADVASRADPEWGSAVFREC